MFLFLFYIEKDTIYMNYKVRQIYKYVLAITYCLFHTYFYGAFNENFKVFVLFFILYILFV